MSAEDDDTFYDETITAAYGIPQEDGRQRGEYTWPKVAAMLREQSTRQRTENHIIAEGR